MAKVLKTVALIAGAVALAATGVGALAGAGIAFTALSASGLALAAGIATVATVVAVGASLVGSLFAPKAAAPDSGTTGATSFRQTITNVQFLYGMLRAGGLISFYHANKQGGFDYRYFVIALAGHSIDAVTGYYLNDELVTVDGSGMVTSGKYAGAAWLWPELGSPDAVADPTFVAECDGMWTTDHRGRGIAKLYAKFKLTDAVIAENMPNMTVVLRGKNDIADPRSGVIGYTTNAILCFYDWLRLPRADGGFGAQDDEIDDDHVSAEANVCDEPVPLKAGGTEPRYTVDGTITTGAAPDDIRNSLLTAFAGEFTYSGGFFRAFAGIWRPPVASLSDTDLVVPLTVAPLATGDAISNQVVGTFNDPTQKYQPQEYPSLDLGTGDDTRQMSLDLPFTKSVTMCQRISKVMLLRSAAERSVTWVMNLRGLATEALDTVQLATTRFGLSNYTWKSMAWGLDGNFAVTNSFKEESPDFYEWNPATDEQAPLPPATPITTPAAIMVGGGSGITDLAVATIDATTFRVEFTLPADATVVGYDIYRSVGTVLPITPVVSDVGGPGLMVSATSIVPSTTTTYRFWARPRLGSGATAPIAGPVSTSDDTH